MPYVRTHGNQVAIVHGERDTTTGKVNQRTLFTFYSKVEAAAAIGENDQEDSRYFRKLLTEANPGIKFNWESLKRDIRRKMCELPDLYPLRQTRSEDGFQKALDEFVRQLLLTDPQNSAVGQAALEAHTDDLAALIMFIGVRLDRDYWRTRKNDDEEALLDRHDPFCWRYEVQGTEVPGDIEEIAAGFYESGDYEEASKLFRLLTRSFPSYAEGYNSLGLIDLREDRPKEAIEQFRKTIKYGRALFPKRMPKSSYWRDHSTRPFMRGLQNLSYALIQAGRFKESLEICQQLERECGEAGQLTATAHRAAAYLNLQYWQLSLDAALELIGVDPSEGFIAAFVSYELNNKADAVELFLHAALNCPHTACILLDRREPKSICDMEVEDHNSGIELSRLLPRFFKLQSKQSRMFFKKLIGNQIVRELLDEAVERTRNHSALKEQEAHRDNFDRWHEIRRREFAAEMAPEIQRHWNGSTTRKTGN